jgi:Zn-dependent protease with chaperone function
MNILAKDAWGHPHIVDVTSDQKILFAMLFVPAILALSDVSRGAYGVVIKILIYIAIIIGLFGFFELVGLAQLLWLLSKGFRLAPRDVRNTISALMHDKSLSAMSRLVILWRPTDYSVNARVNGAPILRIIAVTGGLVAVARSFPRQVRPVLMHERAHIQNADFLIYAMMILLFSGLWMGWRGVIEIAKLPFLVFMLRRRELLADAFAMRFSPTRENYVRLLGMGTMKDALLRPRHNERVQAATEDNVVLRRSGGLVVIGYILAASVILQLVIMWDTVEEARDIELTVPARPVVLTWFALLALHGVILCLRGAWVEKEKGDEPKAVDCDAV